MVDAALAAWPVPCPDTTGGVPCARCRREVRLILEAVESARLAELQAAGR